MKTIQIGSRFEIYTDDLKTHDLLPPQTYVVRFAKMTGFYLELHAPLEVDEKVYGVHHQKVDKVLGAFGRFSRNLGVILSGKKGIGKSIFARMLGIKAIEQGLPVIIVEQYIPGIAAYIESIEQEVMVLFDEFDKTFGNIKTGENEPNPQTSLLSLFDGVASGKKLFVVTCNELYQLNDYLINRPGRFHYHFRFEYPSDAEIREYLSDKLDKQYWPEIDAVIEFSRRVDLNYDCLRSIAFELSTGVSFSEAIKDMNIVNTNRVEYDLALHFENRTVLIERRHEMDMFGQDAPETVWLKNSRGHYIASVTFTPAECVYDASRNCISLGGEDLEIEYDDDDDYKDAVAELKKTKPLYLSITRARSKDIHFAV